MHLTLDTHCTPSELSLEGCRDTQRTKSWHRSRQKPSEKDTAKPLHFFCYWFKSAKIKVLKHPTAVPCPFKMNQGRIINFNFLNSYSKYLVETLACVQCNTCFHTQWAVQEFSHTWSHQTELAQYNIQPCSSFSMQLMFFHAWYETPMAPGRWRCSWYRAT